MFECKYVCVCVCVYNNIPFSNAIPAFSCPINTKPNITKIAPVNTNKIARIINAGTIPLFVHMMKFVEYVCDYYYYYYLHEMNMMIDDWFKQGIKIDVLFVIIINSSIFKPIYGAKYIL